MERPNRYHLWATLCVSLSSLFPIATIFLITFLRIRYFKFLIPFIFPFIVLNICLILSLLISPLSDQPTLKDLILQSTNKIIASEQINTWRKDKAIFKGYTIAPDGSNHGACFTLEGHRGNFILFTASDILLSGPITGSVYIKALEPLPIRTGIRVEERLQEGKSSLYSVDNQWQRISTTYLSTEVISPTFIIFNPPGSEPISLCAWGAQMEANIQTTPYVNFHDIILPSSYITPWQRFTNIAILQVKFLLFLLILLTSLHLWQKYPSSIYQGLLVAYILQIGIAVLQKSNWLPSITNESIGLTFHPNVLAGQFLVIGSFLIIQTRIFWKFSFLIILGFVGLWTTGSRAAFSIAVFSLIIYLALQFIYKKYHHPDRLIAVILIIASCLLFISYDDKLRILDLATDPRVDLPAAVSHIISLQPLFGWGPQTSSKLLLWALWSSHPRVYGHSHNIILEILISHGLVGLLGFTFMVVKFFRQARKLDYIPFLMVFLANMADTTLLTPWVYIPLIYISSKILLGSKYGND
jgi:hypothetical protein